MAEARATELKEQGNPVISLCTGELDSDTPEHIKLAAIEAIKKGYLKYTPSGGLKDLKQAIISKD
jgi:aspartate aminotransferase